MYPNMMNQLFLGKLYNLEFSNVMGNDLTMTLLWPACIVYNRFGGDQALGRKH